MRSIEPISQNDKTRVIQRTEAVLLEASSLFDTNFPMIPVLFDIKGRAAGMYVSRGCMRKIRYNAYVFAKYFNENFDNTVPHEVAHYVTDYLYGIRNIRPHGEEWQEVMGALGVAPQVTASYDLSGLPVRRHRQVRYRCECRSHQLGIRRHNRILREGVAYRCRDCGSELEKCGVDA